jgi:hypothetical protein
MRAPLLCLAFTASFTAAAQPANDNCSGAQPATCGAVLLGTTDGAVTDAAPACGTAITAPGVWYVIAGSDQQVTVSTCPDEQYDTKLNVYQGSCGALVCVAGNDDAGPDTFCSTVGFWAESGTSYFILVQGYNGETGPFALTVTCSEATEDVCAGAIPVACGSATEGSTVGAGADSAPFCDASITAPGVWYAISGTGGQIVVSTCPGEAYDTKLNVYSGPCDALVCVAGNDDAGPEVLCSTVEFISIAGQEYHVLVQGYNGATGPFTLTVSCPDCGSPSALQAFATDVSALLLWSSPNPGSTFQVEYGPAGFAPGSGTLITGASGVDGPPVTIGGLAPSTAYDFYVSEVCSSGSSPWIGPSTFTTLSDPPAANALCSGALAITCGSSTNGNTTQGIFTPGPHCGSANITTAGLWYTFTGNGDDVTLSTCSGSGFDTKISVFTGSCGALICAAGNDDGPGCPGNTSSITLQSAPGTDYLVLVHGYGQDQGAFTLTMSCAPACDAVENDACSAATVLTVQPLGGCEGSTGSNACAFAPAVPNPPCDPYANIVDVWYAFNSGVGAQHVLIVEAGTAQLINTALYEACATPVYVQCDTEVGGPVLLNGLQPETDYLVRVWNGGGTEAGTFSICVEANLNLGLQAPPAEGAFSIQPNPAADHFTLSGVERSALVELRDASGRCVRSVRPGGAPSVTIATEALAGGIYTVLSDGRAIGRVAVEQ